MRPCPRPAASALDLKQGDTLDLACVVQTCEREPVDITGWQIVCGLRDASGAWGAQINAVITDATAGRYSLRAESAQTTDWPAGGLSADIRYTTASGYVMHTRTLPVRVLEPVTP